MTIIANWAELREFAVRYTAAWCSQNPARVAAFYSPDGSLIINDGATAARGRCAITEAVQSFMTMFPDLRVFMNDLLVRNDRAEYHWTLAGTNTGPGGTGNRIRIRGFEVWKFGEGGLIAESLSHFDSADYQRQIELGMEESARRETSAHKFARYLVSASSFRPSVAGSETILGSFPPFEHYFITGRKENFCIHDGYRPRETTMHFDDTSNADQWQLEVYKFAREVCDEYGLKVVCDVGCGSGYKLVTYFKEFITVGIDLPKTCDFLRKKWPDRCWIEADHDIVPSQQIDLVIASDVIEHVLNPDELLGYIKKLCPRYVVLSTPDRNLLRAGTHDGPPTNPAHVREWSFAEFHAYVAQWFHIEEHFISCAAQATQCLLCSCRG